MVGADFPSPENLGIHNVSEKNGEVFSCNAGFVDIDHVRSAADWTRYSAEITFDKLMDDETEFSFSLAEPSEYFVKLTYPEDWERLSQHNKKHIAHNISVELGQYFAYTGAVWHEIVTWFGYKTYKVFPEFHSAFSYEDVFSSLLGCRIGASAIRDNKHEFNEAVTLELNRKLNELSVQSNRVAKEAVEKVKGQWYTGNGYPAIDLKKRNFDIGLSDGFVTPWLIPGISECNGAEAKACPVPNLAFLSVYGFSMRLEIKLKEWEKSKILAIAGTKERIEPCIHFAPIMDYIRKDAVKKYGSDVDVPRI